MSRIAMGDSVYVMDIRGQEHLRRAMTGSIQGYDFEVIWVCREDEWECAARDGREPNGMPWPAQDVRAAL